MDIVPDSGIFPQGGPFEPLEEGIDPLCIALSTLPDDLEFGIAPTLEYPFFHSAVEGAAPEASTYHKYCGEGWVE